MTRGNFAHCCKEVELAGIDCVFLTCFATDVDVYAMLLRSSGVRIHLTDTLDEAEFLLTVTAAKVLLTDALFLDGGWTDAASMVANLHPRVSLVLILDPSDLPAWAQAVERRIPAVLSKPLRFSSLRHAIEAAVKPV